MTMLLMALKSWVNLHSHPRFFCFVFFFKTRKMDVLQGLVQGIIRPWALYSFIISLIPARVRWSKAYDVGEKLTWIYLNYYQEC